MKRIAWSAVLILAACSQGRVQSTGFVPTGPLPRPSQVVLTDFAVTPEQVKLDTGVGATLRRQTNGVSDSQAVTEAAQATQAALSETLAAKLTAYGLPVQRLAASAVPPAGSLLVQGQIVSVNQGNRTRRMLIGLGAGKSSVTADAQLYYVANPSAPQFLQSFEGNADSGHMPGAAETMGAGAAAQTVARSAAISAGTHALAEKYRTPDAENAEKVANALAREIGGYAVQQGWIPATAMQ